MSHQPLSLTEFNNLFRETVELSFPDEFWVIAEISELKVNARGHCYIDFIERDELSVKSTPDNVLLFGLFNTT